MHTHIHDAMGEPGEDVTTWGISRVTGHIIDGKNRRQPKFERLDHPGADGVRVNEWPIEDLSLETVMDRWGAGTYRLHWLIEEPEHADPKRRRRSGGHGTLFTIDPKASPEEPTPQPTPAAPVVIPAAGASVGDMLQFAQAILAMGQQMARPTAGGGGDDRIATLQADLAEMRARADAERQQREMEERHRAELERERERAREAERERDRIREEAERERERDDDRPPFEPGVPLTEQLPAILANALATVAT
ncbi:MAG: hypothetical protein EBS48_09545, partial [Actinobacteria bacterium]|nr:hypothetical protein [Actinomycetota bacterium]